MQFDKELSERGISLGEIFSRMHNIPVFYGCQWKSCCPIGKRNKHGIPLPKLLIFGMSGQREVKGWIKQWLK